MAFKKKIRAYSGLNQSNQIRGDQTAPIAYLARRILAW